MSAVVPLVAAAAIPAVQQQRHRGLLAGRRGADERRCAPGRAALEDRAQSCAAAPAANALAFHATQQHLQHGQTAEERGKVQRPALAQQPIGVQLGV